DKVIEAANGGTDTVHSAISYTLPANVENLILTGAANINGTGNAAANAVTGNAGRNVLDGGAGRDTMAGGAGKDVFVFDTPLNASTNIDRITDFAHGTDTIRLAHADFTALATGALSAGAYYANPSGAAAHDLDNRIVYNAANGALFYDANGSKAGGATQFATLNPHLSLGAGDFFII
ncbi:MAG TPA: calcium-binding protein, partial [Stellaceae bacterium]|nr:calcium-binding protein [Stellaceae bacterium]